MASVGEFFCTASSKLEATEASVQKTLVKNEREYIRGLGRLVSRLSEQDPPVDVLIGNEHFDTPELHHNVRLVICDFNESSQESVTVANCIFDKGGEVSEHLHSNSEAIYVISGSLTETVSGKTYSSGEALMIPSNQLHGFQSDYALISITWRPELFFTEVNSETPEV